MAKLANTASAATIRPLPQLYRALLNRLPDAAGLASWLNSISREKLDMAAVARA